MGRAFPASGLPESTAIGTCGFRRFISCPSHVPSSGKPKSSNTRSTGSVVNISSPWWAVFAFKTEYPDSSKIRQRVVRMAASSRKHLRPLARGDGICVLIAYAKTRESPMVAGTGSRASANTPLRLRACCRTLKAVARRICNFAAAPRLGGEELASEIRSRKSA
jgi:hypothetical protein